MHFSRLLVKTAWNEFGLPIGKLDSFKAMTYPS
jgi:hypothetical protein